VGVRGIDVHEDKGDPDWAKVVGDEQIAASVAGSSTFPSFGPYEASQSW
jgi:hypothetical protein